MFSSIKNSFAEITNKIDNVSSVVEKIGVSVNDSMMQIAKEIENLANTLETLMNINDLKNLRESLHQIVETFRTQLEPQKVQKLLLDLSQSVKNLKEKA